MSFKEITLNLTTEKIGNHWTVIIDGIGYSPKEISIKYNIFQTTVSKHLATKSSEQFKAWLEHRVELNSLGLIGSTILLFKRNGEVCWSHCVMEATGCGSSHANNLLHAWQDGEIDCDELFNPKRKTTYKPRKTTGVGNPNWKGFSNKSRSYNLDKLKSVGTWEMKQPESDGFVSHNKGHVVSRTTKGIYLRGD